MWVIDTKKAQKVRVIEQVPCIYYLMQYQKDKSKIVLALLDFGREVNAMTPTFVTQLGLKMQKTNVHAQKIEKSSLESYDMVIAAF